MIRPLRRRHRRLFIALGLFLPLAFAAGLAARKPPPPANALPASLAAAPPADGDLVWRRGDLFSNAPVEVRLLRAKHSGRLAVNISKKPDFLKPDLIVYWAAGNSHFAGALPEDATLLGECDAPALPLPAEATARNGALVLYSLADNEIVDVSKPLPLVGATP